MHTETKRGFNWKALVAVLLTAVVVVAAALAPGWVLRLQEPSLQEGYYQVRERGQRLDYDSEYFYAGAAITLYRNEQQIQEMVGGDVYPKFNEMFTEGLMEMEAQGVIPGELHDILRYAYDGGANYIYELDIDPYSYMLADLRGGTDNEYMAVHIEQKTGKILRLSADISYIPMFVDEAIVMEDAGVLAPYVEAFAEWLELDQLDDWEPESMYVPYRDSYYSSYDMRYSISSRQADVAITCYVYYSTWSDYATFSIGVYPANMGYYW